MAILRVEDAKGNVLYDYKPARIPNLLGPNSKQLTYLVTSMLIDPQSRAPAFGYPSVLDLENGRPAAVKTGTTNDNKDNWTMGFTPDYAVGVWVGNTDNSPMNRSVTGLSGAAPIWHDVMEYLHRDTPIRDFERPDGLVERRCAPSTDCCRTARARPSPNCSSPAPSRRKRARWSRHFPINRETGKLAVSGTPPELVEQRVLYVFPPQAQDWWLSLSDEEKRGTRSRRRSSTPNTDHSPRPPATWSSPSPPTAAT